MFLVYRVGESFSELTPVMPEDALFDVFQRFHPRSLDLMHGAEDILDYLEGEEYIDSGDWSRGYSTYYNRGTKEKVLVIDADQDHTNPTILRMIRDYRLGLID